jgi:endonuclease YncB( thermonuclease family)
MPTRRKRDAAPHAKRSHSPTRHDPLQLGRLLKRRKALGFVVTLLVVLAIALLDHKAELLPVGDDWHRYHEQSFEVLQVVDGDTVVIRADDGDRGSTRVRLWGVDTPELARDGRPAEPLAEEATEFVRLAVDGQRVTLHLQRHRVRDDFGRILAYVESEQGKDLGEALIDEGFSKHDARWSHDRSERYDAAQRRAREARRGLWAP